jgi:hypothetical protein
MLDTYEGKPSLFDKAVLETSNRAISVEEAVTEIYQTMKSRVYTEDSPFKDTEVWEPFRRDKKEFIDFYQSALNSLEVYREILQDYNLLSRPQLGEIERKGHDKHAHINERMACIQAVQNFHGKFHALLDILSLLANLTCTRAADWPAYSAIEVFSCAQQNGR